MADEWNAGDLALCIRGGRIVTPDLGAYPVAGAKYTVVGPSINHEWPDYDFILFEDAPVNGDGIRHWSARRFIKITPPAADEYDQEIIHLMTTTPHTEEA